VPCNTLHNPGSLSSAISKVQNQLQALMKSEAHDAGSPTGIVNKEMAYIVEGLWGWYYSPAIEQAPSICWSLWGWPYWPSWWSQPAQLIMSCPSLTQ